MTGSSSDTGPPLVLDEDESTWKVLDRIVGERQTSRRAGKEYCVRWKGTRHPDEWVPADDDAWYDGSTGTVLEAWLEFIASQRPAALTEAAQRTAGAVPKRKRVW